MAHYSLFNEAALKSAIGNDLYWKQHDPERWDFVRWVTNSWDAAASATPSGSSVSASVFVRAYSRRGKGKVEHVRAHWRSSSGKAAQGDDGADVIQVQYTTWGHGARHVPNSSAAMAAISAHLSSFLPHVSGSFWGRVPFGGGNLEYRGYFLPGGRVHIGTFYMLR